MRVLLIKLASMGDLLQTLPALSDASRARPDIHFDWMVDQRFQEIPLWHPTVTRIITTNHRTWRSTLLSSATWKEIRHALTLVREHPYDLVIDAHGNFKTALLAHGARGPIVGFDSSSIPEWGAQFFYGRKLSTFGEIHAVQKLRLLLARALDYPMPMTTPDYGIDRQRLAFSSPLPPSYAILVPIASKENKLWKDEHWRTLIREIAPLPIFIPWGNATEYARAKRLSHDFSHAKLLPKMTLSELAYLISHATLVISLDTGLSHMAAALGTPCITLYGPTDPQRVGTKGDHQVWLTSLGTLSPTQVLKAARQWIPSLSLP